MQALDAGPVYLAEVLSLLDGIDVPCAKVQRIDEVLADPQIQARGMVVEQQHPRYGTLRTYGVVPKFSRTPARVRGPAPDMGQHNDAVYGGQLGLGAERLAELRQAGII